MPNLRLIKNQMKSTWIIVLVFAIIYILYFLMAFQDTTFGPTQTVHWRDNNNWSYEIVDSGGGTSEGSYYLINATVFGFASLIMFFVFGILMSMNLLNRDINRGYLVSWFTSGLSRKSVFNSKLTVLLIWTLILNVWIIIIEMLILGTSMSDFSSQLAGYLLLGNLTLICFSFMVVSICWFAFSLSSKNLVGLGITLGLVVWFTICYIMVMLGSNPDMKSLSDFKYITLLSLMNSPLKYGQAVITPPTAPAEITYNAPLLKLDALDFAWQLPLMAVIGTSFLIGSQYILVHKSYSI